LTKSSAPPRFFVDETDLALGIALAAARSDVVHPGHTKLPEVPRQTPDELWLPVIGSKGLVVFTRDQKIRRRPIERRAWHHHGVRGFVLTGKTSQSTWDSMRIIVRKWGEIEAMIEERPSGPWMVSLTGGMREIELTDD
jgi:hypothetical protein